MLVKEILNPSRRTTIHAVFQRRHRLARVLLGQMSKGTGSKVNMMKYTNINSKQGKLDLGDPIKLLVILGQEMRDLLKHYKFRENLFRWQTRLD